MLNSKKIISSLLALSLVTAFPASVCSAEAYFPSPTVYSADSERSINWTYTSFITANITFDGDYAKCTGSYGLYDDYDSKMTITLMKSYDGRNWTAVDDWTVSNNVFDPPAVTKKSTSKLEHGCYYYSSTQVQVLDSNGKSLEIVNSESAKKYYK